MNKKEKNRENNQKKFDLQERLIDYAVRIIHVRFWLPSPCLVIQTSGTSPAPNYGEAQSAESRADFIHKLKVALKSLERPKCG